MVSALTSRYSNLDIKRLWSGFVNKSGDVLYVPICSNIVQIILILGKD